MSSANQVFKNHEIHNFRIQEAYAWLKAKTSKWTNPSSILNATQKGMNIAGNEWYRT